MPHPKVDEVCRHAKVRLAQTIERLSDYLRYPAISCDPDHFDDVRRRRTAPPPCAPSDRLPQSPLRHARDGQLDALVLAVRDRSPTLPPLAQP